MLTCLTGGQQRSRRKLGATHLDRQSPRRRARLGPLRDRTRQSDARQHRPGLEANVAQPSTAMDITFRPCGADRRRRAPFLTDVGQRRHDGDGRRFFARGVPASRWEGGCWSGGEGAQSFEVRL